MYDGNAITAVSSNIVALYVVNRNKLDPFQSHGHGIVNVSALNLFSV